MLYRHGSMQGFYNITNSQIHKYIDIQLYEDNKNKQQVEKQWTSFCRTWQRRSLGWTSAASNPWSIHCWQVVCCGPIRSSSTGTGWRHGSTWQKSGLTGLRGSFCFWKRPKECQTRSLSRPSMRGIENHNHSVFSYLSDLQGVQSSLIHLHAFFICFTIFFHSNFH